MRTIRVAAVQLRAHDRAGFAQALDAIVEGAEAAAQTAQLVVLPEGTFPSYVLGNEPVDDAEIADAIARLCDTARRTNATIVAGAAVRSSDGAPHRNAAVVIDRDGSLAGRADKLFLWHFDRRWFEPGETIAPVATTLGKLGVLVCADGRIPTIARTLVDRGAELLVMPTAWVTSGRNPRALENVQADLLARIRAYENGVPFVAANKCGSEQGMVAYCGKSQAIDASGAVVAMASEREPETIAATLAIGEGRPYRTTPLELSARGALRTSPFRVAISATRLPVDIDHRLETLDDAFVLAPPFGGERFAALDAAVPVAAVSDDEMRDPGGLVPYRRAGYTLAAWEARRHSSWTEPLARARALELRMYVVVADAANDRAFAVDPDGVVVAGTFDDYRLASFSLDPRKTIETTVAPGSDVAGALERIDAMAARSA